MHKLIVICLFFVAAISGYACLGDDQQIIAVVNDQPKAFVFKKGVTSVDFKGSRNGNPCRLEADFSHHRATVVCGRERNGGDLLEAVKSDSFAILFDSDNHKTAIEDYEKIKKFVAEQPVSKGCLGDK